MHIVQITLLLAMIALGRAAPPAEAQEPTTCAGVVGNADVGRTSDHAACDDRELILAVLRGVETAFSDGDLRQWLSFFHSPYVIMAPEGVVAPSSEHEALTILRPQMDALRARGYARSDMSRATVKFLSPTTALAAVEWIRRRSNDDELERLGATYAFFKAAGGWKIVMVTVHPAATLPELEGRSQR